MAGLSDGADQSPRSELELLLDQLGRLRFVHLRRVGVVARAASWAKSLQTHSWRPGEPVEPGAVAPFYDERLIERLVDAIEPFELGWSTWFAHQQVAPFEVTYEQLAADPVPVAYRVLDFLGPQVAEGHEIVVRDHQQADAVNAAWVERFTRR